MNSKSRLRLFSFVLVLFAAGLAGIAMNRSRIAFQIEKFRQGRLADTHPVLDLVQTLSGDEPVLPANKRGARGYSSVSFNHDGTAMAASTREGITVWSTETWQITHRFMCPSGQSLAFSPDDHSILTSGNYNMTGVELNIWDLTTGKVVRTFKVGYTVRGWASFSLDGDWVAMTSEEGGGVVKIWDIQSGELLQTLKGVDPNCEFAFLSSDFALPGPGLVLKPKVIATAILGNGIQLWDATTGRRLQTLQSSNGLNGRMAAQGQGANDLAFLGWDGLAFWRATGTEVRSRGHLNLKGISSVAWMAGGKQIAVGFKDGTVHFWDLQYGFQLKSLQAHTKTVQALACEPSGKWVATIGPDGDLKVWKVSKA